MSRGLNWNVRAPYSKARPKPYVRGTHGFSGLGSQAYNTDEGIFGAGGNGGGVFSTALGSSLGATASYPYGAYSEDTKSLQASANAILPSIGQSTIEEDGILGPLTCAAIKAIKASGKYSGWDVPAGCSAPVVTKAPTPAPSMLTSGSGGTSQKLKLAAIGALGVFGGYWLWKKYVR